MPSAPAHKIDRRLPFLTTRSAPACQASAAVQVRLLSVHLMLLNTFYPGRLLKIPFPRCEDVDEDEMDVDTDGASDGASDVPVEEPVFIGGHTWRKGPTTQPHEPVQRDAGHTFRRGGVAADEQPQLKWKQFAEARGLPTSDRTTIDPRLARLCPTCFGPRKTGTPLAQCVRQCIGTPTQFLHAEGPTST